MLRINLQKIFQYMNTSNTIIRQNLQNIGTQLFAPSAQCARGVFASNFSSTLAPSAHVGIL